MTPELWRRLRALYEQSLSLPPEDRSTFVRKECDGEPELEACLDRLLNDHDDDSIVVDGQTLTRARLAEYLRTGLRTFQTGEIASGRFRITRFIGEGGMGEVYEAEDTELDKAVAIKTLRPELSLNPRMVELFKREVQTAQAITHRNVARVFDVFRHQFEQLPDAGQVTFLTMELLSGGTLHSFIRAKNKRPMKECLAIASQIAAGLDAAHETGIVHRDLKPANVMLVRERDGRTRAAVTDFGLACAVSEATGEGSRKGELAGTPEHMAQEQLAGEDVTQAADIYSFGLILFEMLTGRLPFQGETREETVEMRLHQPAPPVRRFRPGVGRAWEIAIAGCLRPEPRRRPARASAVIRTIQRGWLAEPRILAAIFFLAVVLIGGLWWWMRPTSHNPAAVKKYLEGLTFLARRTADGLRNAVDDFKDAVGIEPRYADAWVGLADAYASMANRNFAAPEPTLKLARTAAQRALAIEPRKASALVLAGYITSLDVRDWPSALPYFQRAARQEPFDPTVCLYYGAYLGKLGRSKEAIQEIENGLEQDPGSEPLNEQLAAEYFRAREYKALLDQARSLVRIQPLEAESHLTLARAREFNGQFEEALQSCDEAEKYGDPDAALCLRASTEAARHNTDTARRMTAGVRKHWEGHSFQTDLLAGLYCQLGDYGEAVRVLNAGFDRYDSTVLNAPTAPHFDVLRNDPGYRKFLERISWPRRPLQDKGSF